jgi:hypothetical protein
MRFVALAMFGLSFIPLPGHAGTWDRAQAAFSEYDDLTGLKLLQQAAEEGDVRAVQAWTLSLLHRQRLFPRLVKADNRQVLAWLEGVAEHCGGLASETTDSTWLCEKLSAMKL